MSYHHEIIRKGARQLMENGEVANPVTDQHMQLGYLLTSAKPGLKWFRNPFARVQLQRQHISLPCIVADDPENQEKIAFLKRVLSSPVEEKSLMAHKEKVVLNRKGNVDVAASSYGSVKANVEFSSSATLDFGHLTYREVDEEAFHKAIDGLKVDFNKWKELKIRNPKSLYVVVRVEISEKLACSRKVSTHGGGAMGVSHIPGGVHATTGADVGDDDELMFVRDTPGVVGFYCARLTVDPSTTRLSLRKYDFTASGRINRDQADGNAATTGTCTWGEPETEDYENAMKLIPGRRDLQEAVENWSKCPPPAAALDFIEELILKIFSAGSSATKCHMPAAWAMDDDFDFGCLTKVVCALLGVLGISAEPESSGEGVVLSWQKLTKENVALMNIIPPLLVLAQDQLLAICRVPPSSAEACSKLMNAAASVSPERDEQFTSFPWHDVMPDENALEILQSIGIKTSPSPMYDSSWLYPHRLSMLAEFAGVFNIQQ